MEIKENNYLKEQVKQTLSITLPVDLYQQLLQEVGKGKISKFIREVIEEKLATEKENLGRAYQECYANNPHLLQESQQWEQAQNEDWISWERRRSKKRQK